MTTDTGGNAYPNSNSDGMTWLDACAMKAMQALATPEVFIGLAREGYPKDKALRDLAGSCYEIAAAMLAEKRRREGGRA